MSQLAVTGRQVVLAYRDFVAVDASDFDIPAGQLTVVIGPNGSGKSTLMNGIAGLIAPAAGRIDVLGKPAGKMLSQVGYVFQATAVNQVMPVTVRETVSMGRYAPLGSLTRFSVHDHAVVDEALERLDITKLARKHLVELSGGERQRVFVAQGLAQEAEIMLLDEPVTGLDIVSRDLIMEAFATELAMGRTIVITTHDLADASTADHVLLMAGRVHSQGLPEDVLTPDLLSSAYGVGIVHLEDGSIVLDDPHHRGARRHVHFERGGRTRGR